MALGFIIPFIYIAVFGKSLDDSEILSTILAVYLFIWFSLMIASNFLINSYDVISKLVFYNNVVLLFSKEYHLNEISEIVVDLEDYFGKDFNLRHGRTPTLIEGINNYIILKFINNERERQRFLIKSKVEIDVIKKILVYYRSKGINITLKIKGRYIIKADTYSTNLS